MLDPISHYFNTFPLLQELDFNSNSYYKLFKMIQSLTDLQALEKEQAKSQTSIKRLNQKINVLKQQADDLLSIQAIFDKIHTLDFQSSLIDHSIHHQDFNERADLNNQLSQLILELKIEQEKIHKTSKEIERLKNHLKLQPEDIHLCFEFEAKLRQLLEKQIKLKIDITAYQAFYDQEVGNVLTFTKSLLKERAFRNGAYHAAHIGEAAQATFKALQTIIQDNPEISNNQISNQEVTLLPKHGIVFKRSLEREEEDEYIISQLFHLSCKKAIVQKFGLKQADLMRWGIDPITEQDKNRGHLLKDLNPTVIKKFKRNISSWYLPLFKYYSNVISHQSSHQKKYEKLEQSTWTLTLPNNQPTIISLKQLYALSVKDRLPLDAILSSPDFGSHTIEHLLITDDSPLLTVMHHFSHQSFDPIYLVPEFCNSDIQKSYEKCEKYQWTYKDKDHLSHTVSFKELHFIHLTEHITAIEPVVLNTDQSTLNVPSPSDWKDALEVEWKVIGPHLVTIEDNQLVLFNEIQSKPFIHMHLLDKLVSHFPMATNKILSKLSSDSQFHAIKTGEFQLLDLHSNNIGLEPIPNQEYEVFRKTTFIINGKNYPFWNFLLDYLNETIDLTQPISYQQKGRMIEGTLDQLPQLQKALSIEWKIVLFDTDQCLAEHNYLHYQKRKSQGYQVEHLIPIRSGLLETSWKDIPLKEEVIQRLMNSDQEDIAIRKWINKDDVAIYQFFSTTFKLKLQNYLNPIIKNYTLSYFKSKHTSVTIRDLKDHFVSMFIDLSQNKHLAWWREIEKELSLVNVYPNDTLETIAKRHGQTIDKLKFLNLSYHLTSATRVRIHYDLTSNTLEAETKRRKIAEQLFPRLTIAQQMALIERQTSRKNYLIAYQQLKHALDNANPNELLKAIETFICLKELPLDSLTKHSLLQSFYSHKENLSKNFKSLTDLAYSLCLRCQPTYFNLMKAMYPLLADAYELNLFLYDSKTAGKAIGHYSFPLNQTIYQIKQHFQQTTPAYELAAHVEAQLLSLKNISFFGNFNI